MPQTRRSTASARGRQNVAKGQSTINFSNKVSKPGARQDAKKAAIDAPKKADYIVPVKEKQEHEDKSDVPDKVDVQVEAEEGDDDETSLVEPQQEEAEAVPEKSEAELEAEKISDAKINKYWKGVEAQSIAPRVHTGDLTVGEKVLRYFDVSSQYGPCVGITRMRRWQRANKLGLDPPIEVLAVLLKEGQEGNSGAQKAHMDQILGSIAVGST